MAVKCGMFVYIVCNRMEAILLTEMTRCMSSGTLSPWHTLPKPAPEIGAIGLTSTPDYGAS